MKNAALQQFRQKIRADQTVLGLWVTLESPSITEMAVGLGLDWVVIDAEHGHLDWKEILEHIRAAVRSSTVVLVRLAELNGGMIKRTLDIGADGVVLPWMESAGQLKQAIAYAQYPPKGLRGIGGERATVWGQCLKEHTATADENVLVIPIIETVRGGQHLNEMLSVPGSEIFFFGPADYSASAGFKGEWEGPGVAQMILNGNKSIRSRGKHSGVLTTSAADLAARQQQGFRMLSIGMDAGLLIREMKSMLASAARDRKLTTEFVPQ
ncbi:MAG: aldolase/citrate lyase family protein [Planctomycetota bacterium]|nr:aldolase/citrate lyase family protein [Planctomycetota bacterium]MDA1211008.1 aldolase/citrate lyase family protein [Planctomycetota bacterium]